MKHHNFFRIASASLATSVMMLLNSGHAAQDDADKDDHLFQLQGTAAQAKTADWGHWGPVQGIYSSWTSHSNRLIPVYSFGIGLNSVRGTNSIYRDETSLQNRYGFLPEQSVFPEAEYFDQTDIHRLQQLAVEQGKKHIVLIVFDGMDWETTRAAAIHAAGSVDYEDRRGSGLHFQDYRGVSTEFGFFVTSPHNSGTEVDVDEQTVINPGGTVRGGYNPFMGVTRPWEDAGPSRYLIGGFPPLPHAVTDSAASATSMTSGIKTYNNAINVDQEGAPVTPIARELQSEKDFAIGIVTSVPISHATPAAAYANNVSRHDYQDLTRDLLGLTSIAHPENPLPGVDVLLGAGWGIRRESDAGQGGNFESGNRYLADSDRKRMESEGTYRLVSRTAGQPGGNVLREALEGSLRNGQRLFGFFGTPHGHLPYQTADGGYNPAPDVQGQEAYSEADILENPTLAEMTETALDWLTRNGKPFWLMIESGDVDWANHANNIDSSIGAVLSGDAAFRKVTEWAEANDCWDETAVIVTADHGHYLVLNRPEALIPNETE